MKLRYILILYFLFFSSYQLLKSQTRINKVSDSKRDGESMQVQPVSKIFYDRPIRLECSKLTGDYFIGPEIAIPGATGFYDYQTNGECKHYINRYDNVTLSAVYMTSTDSMNISNSMRTIYSGSFDEGAEWFLITPVPFDLQTGFPSLTAYNGRAVICNHDIISGKTNLSIDLLPLIGSFSSFELPYTFGWPGCGRFSDDMIMIAGELINNGTVTDTGIVTIFNPVTHLFSNTTRFRSNASSQVNMRWTYAAGPNGKALYLLNPISDVGGNGGYNRMFIALTTDHGVTWSSPMLEFFNPQVLLGEMAIPFYGLDAIYDSFGNYYVAFNTTNTLGEYGSARLWVSKNGGTPVLVAQHNGLNGIPEAASTLLRPQAGLCTIDHPSLSVSNDGEKLYVAYGVIFQNDTLNGFNKSHIYLSYANTSDMQFNSIPIKVTNSGPASFDERYVSIAQTTPDLGGALGRTVYMVYQKDPQPGSSSFNDQAPISRASLVFRTISGLPYIIDGIGANNSIPLEMKLQQNYPNPFNPVTVIEYSIPKGSNVELKVYDMLGREVEILVNSFLRAGYYKAEFTGKDMPSGVYMYKLSAGNFVETKKMLLVK